MTVAAPTFRPAAPIRGAGGWWVALAICLFLGLSIAAVETIRIDCRAVLLTGDGALLTGGQALLTADGAKQCSLVVGEVRVALPAWIGKLSWF